MNQSLFVRHGAVLGLAEVVLALGQMNETPGNVFDDEALDSVVELVARMEKARLYRGRGGQIMRSAICRLIECISQVQLPLSVKQQVYTECRSLVCNFAILAERSRSYTIGSIP